MIRPIDVAPLEGTERFSALDLQVIDFWRWGFSDLRTNIVRGVLAEFLVAKALGDPTPFRRAWDNFDVTAPGEIRIEVKSSAYLQSWHQKALSKISFGGLFARSFCYETNELSKEREYRADVYVFAAHTLQDPNLYDALDLTHWRFYVVPVSFLKEHKRKDVTDKFLQRHGYSPIELSELPEAVQSAYRADGHG